MNQHIKNALDWLEANPEKHISMSFSVDKNGTEVPPTDESAECFCALGRIAKEAGIRKRRDHFGDATAPYEAIQEFLHECGYNLSVREVYGINDRVWFIKKRVGHITVSHEEVIAELRDLFDN